MNGQRTQLNAPKAQPAVGILLVSMIPPGYEEAVRAIFKQLAAIPDCFAESEGISLDRMMSQEIMRLRAGALAIVGSYHLANRYGQMFQKAMQEQHGASDAAPDVQQPNA